MQKVLEHVSATTIQKSISFYVFSINALHKNKSIKYPYIPLHTCEPIQNSNIMLTAYLKVI